MRKFFYYVLAFLFSVVSVASCGGGNGGKDNPDDDFNVSGVTLPSTINVVKGGTITLSVLAKKGPASTDLVILRSASGTDTQCKITAVTDSSFSFSIPEDFTSGYYTFIIKRDDDSKTLGKVTINIVSDVELTPKEGCNVYGIVECDGVGIPDVVVSDGVSVTSTDKDGIYNFKSEKKWGYVFISVPSGYEVSSDGILPKFHQSLTEDASVAERADFALSKVQNDKFTLFVLGDIHLADRNEDRNQFFKFTDDLNDYMTSHSGTKMYGITLGDMTWDLYWYSNSYYFPQYLRDINSQIKDLEIFHTMGNHDNDMDAAGDFNTATKYVRDIAPTYYSFNIGKIHFIVLDDIYCTNDGTGSRTYKKTMTGEELDWIKKDLSYVSTSTPIVVTTHAPIFSPSSATTFKYDLTNTTDLLNEFANYKVHFITGHVHANYNVDRIYTGGNIFEHNTAAICASWWWSDKLTPGLHICIDGSPGGYAIWNFDGTDINWRYKGTGWDENYQFRSYDLNNVSFTMADVPNMPSSLESSFKPYMDAYPKNSDNNVLVNVWNWDPEWSISITENGTPLAVTQVMAYDPLHIAALTVKRFNTSGITSAPSFITELSPHFFKATAANATDDLVITVKDDFGNVYTENMERPKAFSTDAYLNK
ncbi:MAG: calcineurin-like phosphoesterase family protein [Bacteroidales bacterium]|nr:calcineurin-like phosphoesterase family protein [Bacteroidales bacterium]MCI1785097.1 calcineurin-like phosphoesterase family protein [Bacteroidales bacterium]